MATGTFDNPWYQPGQTYGGGESWKTTPLVKRFLGPQIPEGVFMEFAGNRGFGGTDAQSEWVQGLYGKTLAGYKAAMLENPNLDYRTYLARTYDRNSLKGMFNAQSPRAKGYYQPGPTRLIANG